jgi:hypothetical protein
LKWLELGNNQPVALVFDASEKDKDGEISEGWRLRLNSGRRPQPGSLVLETADRPGAPARFEGRVAFGDSFTQLVLVYDDETKQARAFSDGLAVGSMPLPGDAPDLAALSPRIWFEGAHGAVAIDEMATWDRALSDREIITVGETTPLCSPDSIADLREQVSVIGNTPPVSTAAGIRQHWAFEKGPVMLAPNTVVTGFPGLLSATAVRAPARVGNGIKLPSGAVMQVPGYTDPAGEDGHPGSMTMSLWTRPGQDLKGKLTIDRMTADRDHKARRGWKNRHRGPSRRRGAPRKTHNANCRSRWQDDHSLR